VVEFAPPQKKLMDNSSLLQLASSIIDARDNINAIFHQKHKEKLLLLNEERDLLQLFRDADSEEQFFFRLSALKNIATHLNIKCLRQLTGVSDNQTQSIHLLETYLNKLGDEHQNIVETLRKINNLRQGYPIHGDRTKGVLGAHRFFSFDYPITEYSASWKRLLTN
jgi:ERCC4-type nuclease